MTESAEPSPESTRSLPGAAVIRFSRGRPWQVSVIAFPAIIFGYLGVLLKPAITLPYLSDMRWLIDSWQAPERIAGEWAFQVYVVFAVGVFQSALCLVSGMGLLKMREWARKGILVYAVLSLFMTAAYVAFQIYSSDEVVKRVMASTTEILRQDDVRAGHMSMVVVSTMMRLPFLLLILGFMLSGNVRQAFERQRLIKS